MFSQLRMREEQALLAHDYALEQAEEKDLERGRAEGIEQGLERGLERGRAEGIEQGREEGLERGKLFAFLELMILSLTLHLNNLNNLINKELLPIDMLRFMIKKVMN